MKISHHLTLGVIGCIPIYYLTKNYKIVAVYFATNSLIDIDHFLDYWYDHGFNLSWKRFHKACGTADFIHFIIFLHSFELLFLISIFLFFSLNSYYHPYFLGIFLGVGCHLVSDVLYNKGVKPKYYLILNRYMKNFKLDNIANPIFLNEARKR